MDEGGKKCVIIIYSKTQWYARKYVKYIFFFFFFLLNLSEWCQVCLISIWYAAGAHGTS